MDVTRFWGMVSRREPDQCWEWTGDRSRNGYGVFVWHGKRTGAHEVALSFTTGEVKSDRLDTCHSCDNPLCCNPAHLRFDTRLANVREMHERGRARKARKVTDEDVVLIRERRAAGARQSDLAEQFGITDGAVSMIVRGLRWPDAGGPIERERRYVHGK